MKKLLEKPIKMRSRINLQEVFWTYSHWKSNFVDGVEFLPVVRHEPSQERTQPLHYVRKDSLEKMK